MSTCCCSIAPSSPSRRGIQLQQLMPAGRRGDSKINVITSRTDPGAGRPLARFTGRSHSPQGRAVRAHHITEEIITVGHLLYARHAGVSRLPALPAVGRINQPKNYKHTRRLRRAAFFQAPVGRVRPRWRYFSQCASHNLTAADASVSSYSERSTTPGRDGGDWRGGGGGGEEAICWMFAGWGRSTAASRLLRRRGRPERQAPSPVD